MMKKEHLYYLDIFKALACFGVFFGHITHCFVIEPILNLQKMLDGTIVSYLYNGGLGIHVFFVISGFLIAYHNVDSLYSEKQYKFFNRMIYLYIPCAVLCGIAYLCYAVGFVYCESAYELGASEFLNSFSKVPLAVMDIAKCYKGIITGVVPPLPHLWTMKYEFMGGTACFFVLFFLGDKVTFRWLAYLGLSVLSIVYFKEPYYEAFLMGMLACEICFKLSVSTKRRIRVISGAVSIGLLWFASSCFYHNKAYIMEICLAISLVFGYLCYFNKQPGKVLRLLVKFNRYSFSFYLVHFLVIFTVGSYLYTLLICVGLEKTISSICVYFATFTVSLLAAIIVQKCVVDRIPSWTGKLYMSIK